MPRPSAILASVWLQVGTLACSVVWFIIDVLAEGFATTFNVLLLLIVLMFWGFIATKIWAGRNWARVVLTVTLPFQLGFAVGDAVTRTFAYSPIDYLGCLLSVGAVILLWVPASRSYFAAMKAARHRPKPVKPYLDPKNR